MNSNDHREEFSDATLENVCAELMRRRLAELEAAETGEHVFSPEFERKMDALLKQEHKKNTASKKRSFLVPYKMHKIAASIVLVIALFSLLTQIDIGKSGSLDPPIDATVSTESAPPSTLYIPAGFEETTSYRVGSGGQISSATKLIAVYANAADVEIFLYVSSNAFSEDLSHTEYRTLEVDGVELSIYSSLDPEKPSYLFWQDSQEQYHMLYSVYDCTELTKMAISLLN